MKKLIKIILYFFLNLLPAKKRKNQAIVLMYHSISDSQTFFSVSLESFKKQMQYLVDNKYNVVSLEKIKEYLDNQSIPSRTVAITFDDGYEDNYFYAFPVLRQYSLPAAIFISTAMIGSEVEARNKEKFKILNFNEIIEMKNSDLLEIGAHGHKHKKLVSLSETEINQEFVSSKKILEEKLRCKIKLLAYPSGKFNDSVKVLAQKYFKMAFTVFPGKILLTDDLFALKRNSIDSQVSWPQFKHIVKHGKF